VSPLFYYWATIACLLAFVGVVLAVLWDQGKLRRRQDELTARVDRIDPPAERGRHRQGNGSTAVDK
jgi:hypothetical protein